MSKKIWNKMAVAVISGMLISGSMAGSMAGVVFAESEATTSEATAPDAATEGIVQTTAGKIQGTKNNGIYQYLGVPYAEAKERFVPAGEVTPWEGVRMADSYGSMSPQGAIMGMAAGGDREGTDNNCQNLNIWTPGIQDGKKRPVMVWLHGGGFSTGTANDGSVNGTNLSQSGDVVVVGVNHRLNIFGHLDLSAYGEKYQYSGNVGVMDIAAALQWIQDNIEHFGGDPDNVTIFGQSGGGAKVLALMTTPYAEGLFHKGIVQSGATDTLGVTFTSKEASLKLTERILENLNISAENIEDLQNVSTGDLMEASNQALQDTAEEFKIPAPLTEGYAMEWGPVVDGDYIPTNPVTEDSFADAGKDIPLLIGSNLNEWTAFMPAGTEVSDEVSRVYEAAYPNEDPARAGNVDSLIRLPMLKIMSHKADQNGAAVYSYVFTYDGQMGAYHGAEIPFVFKNLGDQQDAEVQTLADQISQAWVSFARNGVPEAEGMPEWEAYDRENGATMLLDITPQLVYHHDKELMALLEPEYIY
ncbi:MAG: carboxylesterase/lipase family protein [Clostridiales bacterium]|nr:carboxylesterase/lipase family protein [Clostridiales bacterium]